MSYYLAAMEFAAIIQGEKYSFSSLNNSSFLVTGKQREYILYKTKEWRCADEITQQLLHQLGNAIEQHLQVVH